ncbi:unnamed protein product [Peronospora destructor]|uniref:GRIP domain-containing protein n=1 Tax=Peronospora destructor TaxID=86335 RepID=A0AAV0VB30_9STRA|nr:unnamed protein product [Peronospora destructor]
MLKKKEKLEQMRELGRGGLSKGLHFLRSAAVNSSVENNEALASSAASEGGSEMPTTNRMTYEELVALSMKLTRQNKLMKVQYQKNQNKLIAAETNNADVQTLRGFLEHEVGLDVTACVKAISTTSEGTIDIETLTEKYRILAELKQQELQHDTKSHVAAVESVNLLELSPLVTKKTYEEIDLLGDTGHCNVQTKQMDEVMEQVERMSEQLKQGAEYTKELEKKLAKRVEQQEAARRVLEEEKMRLKKQEQQWREKWEEQRKLVDELMDKQEQEKEVARNEEQKEETTRLAEEKQELESRIRDMSEQLDVGVKLREAEQQETADVVAKIEHEKADLAQRLQQAETAVSAASTLASKVENESMQKMKALLEAQRADLEAANAENKCLREKIQTLQEAPSTCGVSEDKVKEEVSAALEAQQSELEAAKAENARLQEKVEALHQTTSVSACKAQEGDAEGIINSPRVEIDCLQGALAAKSDSEGLRTELAASKEQVQKLQEELSQKDSNNAADAAFMQELEQVRLASAVHAHEMQVLQEKLYAAEEHLGKANSDGEATQSLVEALKDDTSRLADQVAKFEEKQVVLEEEILALTEAKRELEERQEHAHEAKATMEKQLEEERAYWTSKLENLISGTDAAKSKTETLEAKLRKKEKEVTKMAASQTLMTSELIELQKQVTSMREDLSMAAEGLEAHATKAEDNERRYIQSEKEVAELKKQLNEVHEEHHENFEMLRQEKEAELKRAHIERRALTKEKKKLLREKDELHARCKGLECQLEMARKHQEELEASLSDKTSQVGNLSADLAEKKKSLSDRMALATRLQTENMDMAGKLAEQVALIESALRDAANSKAAQCEMENQVQVAKADVQRMKQSETKAKHDLENVQRKMVNKDESFQLEREEAKEVLQAAVRNEKQIFRRELERLEAESKQKSKLALQAVLQKEKEIARLRARLDELEEDVRSGGADNRKILEFAELQAKREVEARTQAVQMQALTAQLEEAYRELQELRENKHRHAEELNAVLQNQRRDGVNMEYLKNVVVQYMSFQSGSSQQERLIPVLFTLLQFTAADVKKIKDAEIRGNSWTSWGSSDASLDYKPIVVGASHRHPMAPGSSATGRTSALARMASAPMSPPESSRASSFLLPNGSNGESAER